MLGFTNEREPASNIYQTNVLESTPNVGMNNSYIETFPSEYGSGNRSAIGRGGRMVSQNSIKLDGMSVENRSTYGNQSLFIVAIKTDIS